MTADTILNLLTVANRIYRGRYGFTGPQDLAETAQAWSHVLPDVNDEEGADAFREHLRSSVFPPTTADILDLVKLSRAIGPVLVCAQCGATDDLIVQDDDETRLCSRCHIKAHGGICDKRLTARLLTKAMQGPLVDENGEVTP